ncbi:MAG: prenyltransferase/squalene oxidase repeat-containing protein [Patescibacteria group bacterium]|jgi:prenyltransferase beta subunit
MKKIFLIIWLFLFFAIPSFAVSSNQTAIDSAIYYLRTQQKTDGQIDGFSGVSDWAAMAFSTLDIGLSTVSTASGQTLDFYLRNNSPATNNSSTDWSRRILAVTADNQNPYDYSGVNLVDGLKTYYKNNQIGNETAINDDIFGLLALVAGRESTSSAIMIDTASFIISHQHTDGSFSYSSDPSVGGDIDDTASAIISLTAVKTQGVSISNLQTATDKAKNYLLSHQNVDGGFAYDPDPSTSWDTTSNVSTTSWVVMALAALRMNNDASFVNAQNYLLSTQQSDGSFPYQPAYPPGDTFDTSYVITALKGVFWPIKIFSGTIPASCMDQKCLVPTISPTSTSTNTPTPIPIPTSTPQPTTAPTSTPKPTATPYPTPTSFPNKLIQPIQQTQPTASPTPFAKQVLGVQAKETNKKIPVQTIVFFGLGFLFIVIDFLKLHF